MRRGAGRRTDLDESDVRVRPHPRGSRPRSKHRPAHADATPAMVLAVDRGRYTVLTEDGTRVTAMRAREIGRAGVVVGDRVALVGDVSGAPGTLARIVRVQERRTVLRRSADDVDASERVLVANADQLVVVSSLARPEPRPRMIDRCLVAAYDAGMAPLLVLTKADLAPAEPVVALYEALEVPTVVTSVEDPAGLHAVRERLAGRVSVLVGHSGVGKSTLVNALVPAADRTTGDVNATTGRGRHVSTSAVALPLPEGGWVIDTPGVRAFGLAHVRPERLVDAFDDLATVAEGCPRGCTHTSDAPDCALDDWVASGAAGAAGRARLDSVRRLLASRAGAEDGDGPAGHR